MWTIFPRQTNADEVIQKIVAVAGIHSEKVIRLCKRNPASPQIITMGINRSVRFSNREILLIFAPTHAAIRKQIAKIVAGTMASTMMAVDNSAAVIFSGGGKNPSQADIVNAISTERKIHHLIKDNLLPGDFSIFPSVSLILSILFSVEIALITPLMNISRRIAI